MRDILIGIDAGTSVIKSVAFDLAGIQIAVAAVPNIYKLLPGGGSEQDMALTWENTAATLRMLAQKVENLASRTIGISVTAQGDGNWLIDKAGEPVGHGWLWLDARAGDLVSAMRGKGSDALRYSRTGTGLAACQQGSQLRYMQDQSAPELRHATTAFHCKDWLYFRLTGIRATDPSEAVFTFGDIRTRSYCNDVIEALGLTARKHLLPAIVDGANLYHPLSSIAAQETGLLAGTPVVLGYVDVVCTALGAGLYEPGSNAGCTILGSTGMHMRLARSVSDVHLNPELTGYTMCLPVPGHYAQMQSNMAATLNIDWILSMAGQLLESQGIKLQKSDLIELSETWLARSRPGTLLYHPYISEAGERGPFVDATARASFIGLSMATGFGDMVRAVYDGLALSARDCYAAMGTLPDRVRLTGGAARSQSLRKILGGALGASIQTSGREEAGAAGTAMIAAVALKIYPSMAECVHHWVSPFQRPPEEPDRDLVLASNKIFPVYKQSRQALQPVWHSMTRNQDQEQ